MKPKARCSVHFRDERVEIPEAFFSWLENTAQEQNRSIFVTYVFCSDDQLLQVNQKHLNHNDYTDIITFDLSDDQKQVEGEIYISLDRIKENHKTFEEPFQQELIRVMTHGIFHLLGQKDKTEKEAQEMRSLENEAIQKIL